MRHSIKDHRLSAHHDRLCRFINDTKDETDADKSSYNKGGVVRPWCNGICDGPASADGNR